MKVIHRAKHIRPDGAVSPLCAKTPKPIDLSKATWTIQDSAVTCQRCRKLLAGFPGVDIDAAHTTSHDEGRK